MQMVHHFWEVTIYGLVICIILKEKLLSPLFVQRYRIRENKENTYSLALYIKKCKAVWRPAIKLYHEDSTSLNLRLNIISPLYFYF